LLNNFNSFRCFSSFRLPRCHLPTLQLLWPGQVTPQLVLHHFLHAHGLKIQKLQIIWLGIKVYCHVLILGFSSISDIDRWFYILCTRYRCYQCYISLSLSSVLCVMKFSFNLLSISRIARSLNCWVTFFLLYCVFQKLETRKTIGIWRECSRLYYLDSDSKPIACSSSVLLLSAVRTSIFTNFKTFSSWVKSYYVFRLIHINYISIIVYLILRR